MAKAKRTGGAPGDTGYAKRTGGAPGQMPDMKGKGQQKGLKISKTDKKKRDAKKKGNKKAEEKGKSNAAKFLAGPKEKKAKGKSVAVLKKEATAIRKGMMPKPVSKMKKAELVSFISSNSKKSAPSGLG